ncbi:LOW QUALITY PROTEIN: promotilin [Trichechus inunguis]
MVSQKTVAALLVVHVATMLTSQTEAFVPIFTYSEFQGEREQNKGQKKFLSVQQRSEKTKSLDPMEPTEEEESKGIKLTAPVEIGMSTDSRQLEKYRAALEGLLSKMLLSTLNGMGVGYPPPTLVLIFQEHHLSRAGFRRRFPKQTADTADLQTFAFLPQQLSDKPCSRKKVD